MKYPWTDKRLGKLFRRYNRRYWSGKLSAYSAVVGRSKVNGAECYGLCERQQHQITINVALHESDLEIRATLLHEMAHAASERGHGYDFWGEIERLLWQRAPVRITVAEAPNQQIFAEVVPRMFPLTRKKMERLEAIRARSRLR